MSEYQGPERRQDNVHVRLALIENNIERIRQDLIDEIRISIDGLFLKMDKQQENCKTHNERTARLENSYDWIYKLCVLAWTAILSLGTWFYKHDIHKVMRQ